MLPLYVTSGEPAGIGPDICLSLADRTDERPIVVLADLQMLKDRAKILQKKIELIEYKGQIEVLPQGQLYVEHVPLNADVVLGELNPQNAAYVLEQLRRSAAYAIQGKSVGVATAPVQKSVINDAGIHFSGHTEYYQEFAGVERVVMMLATKTLRVALATTHLPLREVADAITATRLQQVIDILLHDLKSKFQIAKPRVLVCGLNPHAGKVVIWAMKKLT
jgi:4-hydroxythreonine-4-phosphate dehydrogenase